MGRRKQYNKIIKFSGRRGGSGVLGGEAGEEAPLASERGERRELIPKLLCGTYTDFKETNVADKNENNSP